MKNTLVIIIAVTMGLNPGCKSDADIFVNGAKEPVISLSGTWKINLNPYRFVRSDSSGSIKWGDIQVPGECMMQGYPIKHDMPVTYKTDFTVPYDFSGKSIFLRFEGVYSYARVWIGDNFVCDHSGGFSAWECDITPFVNPGKRATLFVEVTDRADEISYASGYAKHQIGGILRNVSLLALPENYPEIISVITDFDETYTNALLEVKGITKTAGENLKIGLELLDKKYNRIAIDTSSCKVSGNEFEITNLITSPLKWDAEHPNLYHLKVSFSDEGKVIWHKYYDIGFREIEISGNKFLLNGREVKLRGACRHDIHPVLGRVSTPEYELKDVLLAKEANINFIRTSHYPPTDNFLKLCDKYGIYVEDETAVCFVGSHRTADYYPGSTESSPDYTEKYLSQLREMVHNQMNHPSVIMWSIGNENSFGGNFKKSYDWAKSADPSRPVIFSYPGSVPDSVKAYDVLSMHYPGINGDMNQYNIITKSFGHKKIPVIFDEWAHVACYNYATVMEDPNIRDFWGMSLDSMWQRVYDSDGGLGGAIWGMIDETFMLPEDLPGFNEWWGKLDKNIIPATFSGPTIGYGEWGIVDTWRRKKPEFWSVKKAYSPVRLLLPEDVASFDGKSLSLPVYNRFDFTNLNEIRLKITVAGKSKFVEIPDLPAHSVGKISAEIENWPENESVFLEFIDSEGNLIDSYSIKRTNKDYVAGKGDIQGETKVNETEKEYIILCNDNNKFRIDKSTGLFTEIEINGNNFFFSGPFPNIRIPGWEAIQSSDGTGRYKSDWIPEAIKVEKNKKNFEISVKGNYRGIMKATLITTIFPDGQVNTSFTAGDVPVGIIREAGIRFITANCFDSLGWKRKPYWSTYPAGHLSASEGKVALFPVVLNQYRKSPMKEWQYDCKSFFYNGIENESGNDLTNIARAAKENITEYVLCLKKGGNLTVFGEGKTACRIEKTGENIVMSISNIIDYPDLGWGNYTRNVSLGGSFSGTANFRITDQ